MSTVAPGRRPPKGWLPKEVGIATQAHPNGEPVAAFVSDSAPGLAVTPIQGSTREYGITHIRSGLLVASFSSRTKAARVAELIAPFTDWTKSPGAIYRAGIGQSCMEIFKRFQ